MNWHRLIILIRFDFLNAIFRLKGLVFIIPYIFFWYCLFYLLIDQGTEFLVSQQSFALTTWLFNPETAQSLLLLNPPTLSVFLILSLATTPFFVMLAGNNQLASDSNNKTFRYLLTRCTRIEIFLARFISAFLLMLSIILCVSFIATIISLQHDSHEVIETSRYAVQVTLNIFLYTLPFFAYMSVISALMSSALGSLLISAVIYIFLLFLGHYLSLGFSLLPSGLKENLYAMNIQNAGQTIIGLLIYTLVYISLGWLIFRKRNL